MNDCPNGDMRDRLPELLHDRLPGATRRDVERHLTGCDDCRAELALLRQLRSAMGAIPMMDTSVIVAALPAPRARQRRMVGWRAAAAIAAIAVGGTSAAIVRQHVSSVPARTEVAQSVADDTQRGVSSGALAVGEQATSVESGARELAVSGSTADLSDGELASLLENIETLDVLPSADVERTSLSPANTSQETL